MSRRSSSKSSRGNGTYQVSENSLGAALAAKDPDTARKMASDAAKANTPEARSRGGPKIMPGDLTPSRKLRQERPTHQLAIFKAKEEKIEGLTTRSEAEEWAAEDHAHYCVAGYTKTDKSWIHKTIRKTIVEHFAKCVSRYGTI